MFNAGTTSLTTSLTRDARPHQGMDASDGRAERLRKLDLGYDPVRDPDLDADDPRHTRYKVLRRLEGALGDAALARELEYGVMKWTGATCKRDGVPPYWVVHKGRASKKTRVMSRFRYRYTTRALSLEFNLRNPRNPELARRFKAGEISVRDLLFMRPEHAWPARWEEVRELVRFRQLRREAATMDPATAPDGAYTCSKCRSRKTVYTELQTRSADEPTTKFVRCLQCGKAWKD